MQADIAIKTAAELSPFALFMQADIVVKAVMFGLLLASVWSWAIILERSRRLSRLNAFSEEYLNLLSRQLDGMDSQ